MNSILVTLYIYILFPYKKLIINIFVFSSIKLEFYIYILLFLIIYIYILRIITGFFKTQLLKKKLSIYFSSSSDVIKSYILVAIFTMYYIIYLRLLTVIVNKEFEFNVFFYKKQIILYAAQYSYTRFVVILILSFIVLIYCVFFILNYIVFFFYKKHFLKLHYYQFLRNEKYRNFLSNIKKIEIFFFKVFGTRYKIYIFVRQYFLKIYLVIYFLINIFLNDGEIGSVLKLFPYISFYYFIINIYSYIFINFKHDFDILIMEYYYKKSNFLMEKNELKKKEYIENLLFSSSKFVFEDCIYYDFLLIQTYKYSINKPPNDFFSLIKRKKPEIPLV